MPGWFQGFCLCLAMCAACSSPPRTWVAFYGTDTPPELLQDYGVVVVDSAFLGNVAQLGRHKAKVLAYISLGELNAQRPQFEAARQKGLFLQENPTWKGAWMVDIRDERWHALVLDELAPPLLARGFDGFFLDTVDSALNLEDRDPVKFAGMRKAAIQLLNKLHARYPAARLLLNGALPIAGQLRGTVDWVAVESSVTTWNFETKTARWRTPDEKSWVKTRLQKAQTENPDLVVFTLDYWDPEDRAGLRAIYREQRAHGFVPYVATVALDRVVPEPAPPPEP